MKKLTFLLLISISFAWADTIIVMCRHAEKEPGRNPGLTTKGKCRAKALASLTERYPFKGVYSSSYKRTLATATPLASKLGFEINHSISPVDFAGLKNSILSNFKDQAVFVVGHSNTIPQFVNYLLPSENLETIPEDEFDNLFEIKIDADNAVTFKRLKQNLKISDCSIEL